MKNKKLLITIGVSLLILILLIISFNVGDNSTTISNDADTILANAQKESTEVKDEEKKEFTNINVSKYLEYYKGADKQLVLIARPTCSYCQIAEPIIQNVAYEYNIDINYLNTDDFTEEDQTNFISSNELFTEGFGTPILLLVGKENIIDTVDGLTDKAHYIEFFKTNGYIK